MSGVDAGAAGGTAGGAAGGAAMQVVRFVAIGDTGKGNTGQNAVGAAIGTVCAARGCDFAVMLGDNFYPSGVSSTNDPLWQSAFVTPYAPANIPFYAVLGNHDYGGDGAGYEVSKADIQVAYSQVNPKWRMPALHYRFTQGHAEFFALDTNRTFWGNDTQTRADMTSWINGSTATWKIALGHHPYRSNGPHGNAGDYDRRCTTVLGQEVCASPPGFVDGRHVKSFMESIVCGRADVYLAGHDHSAQWLVPTCNGTQLLVSGAGASATTVDMKNPVHFQTTDLGFFYIELNARTFTATYYDQTGTMRFTRSFTK
jgi:tartrate-resistant acid phosphatase type 5